MKRILLLILPVLSLIACSKGNHLPLAETITKGNKWGIEIGSTPADVYSQLQAAGKEKGFNEVAVVYRQPFSTPQQIQHLLGFYQAITLLNNTAVIDRVIIQFNKDSITEISAGGALPAEIAKWPDGISDEIVIHENDPVEAIYAKLQAIYQIPAYSNYQIILPDKTLEKPFDPDMANYNEWAFSFSTDVKPGTRGTSAVRLIFKNGTLSEIRHGYNEATVYN